MQADAQPELILRPSRRKMTLLLGISLVFVAIGVLAIGKRDWLPGLLCTIFFGLCAAVSAFNLQPGASYLKLTPDGFIVCTLFRPSPLIPWRQVSGFRVGSLPPAGHRMVLYDSTSPARPGLRQFNRHLTGATDGLPDNYGMKHEELADLMNDWRDRAR